MEADVVEKNYDYHSLWKPYKLLMLLAISGWLAGCTSPFLQKEEVARLSGIEKQQTTVIYFKKQFKFSVGGGLEVTLHKVIKVGSNTNAIPDLLETTDSPTYRLTDFYGRIIKRNGDVKNLDENDVVTVNESDKSVVTQSVSKMLSVNGEVADGDMIEEVDVHVNDLPELGISFSLDEIGNGENITCLIDVPDHSALYYRIVNDSTTPRVDSIKGGKEYSFHWNTYVPKEETSTLAALDNYPEIVAAVRDSATLKERPFSWEGLGDWYLKQMSEKAQYDSTVRKTAEEVTKGLTNDKEKMDAIFNYCQRYIRFEEVYLKKGEEYIPHDCASILANKYGDCKDYSCLMYSMAKSVGLNPNFALCVRGRGDHFFSDLPVDQFNHDVVHYEFGGTDWWYDGTNKQGIPGLVSSDLINQPALILEQGKSRLVTIEESENDLLSISGKLVQEEDGFVGKLTIVLKYQYAVDFLFTESQLNKARMQESATKWITETLSPTAEVKEITWRTKPDAFVLDATVELPNSASLIGGTVYSSFHRLFPLLFPSELSGIDTTSVYYFPYYDKVNLRLNIRPANADSTKGQVVEYKYAIDPGPIDSAHQSQFKKTFHEISDEFNNTLKLNAEK